MLRRILVLSALTIWSIGANAAKAGDCARVTRIKLDHAAVTSAEIIAAGSAIRTSGREELPAAKSEFCRVLVTSRPTADSEIRFELWVPSGGGWNGKFEQVGNGGFAGSLPYRLMAHVLSLGYAVAGTDDGHRSDEMTDASWALNHPEKVKDYGWRAIHETTVDSKRILRDLTSRSPTKSYFVGCSDGGREALMMAQRYPTYFDGIIAGAPAYTMTRLLTGGALRTVELGGSAAHLSTPQLMLLQSRALQSCGNGAPYLKDPRQCHIEAAALKCTGGETESCLSEVQIRTAQVMYAERRDPASGRPLYGVQPGAEAIKGSWDAWLTGTDDHGQAAGMGFTWNYLAYMVMHDPKLDIGKVTDTDLIRGERQYASIMDSDNPDLSAFKAHGGKLIHYHGWNDPAIPPGYSLEYRDRLTAKTGGANDFYRLYMVPGMLHCSGGDAPTNVNWQAALESWVEKSEAPGDLIAGDGKGATQVLEPFN
jgi:pimeloyl-ACP methyl ester carboxylesterase